MRKLAIAIGIIVAVAVVVHRRGDAIYLPSSISAITHPLVLPHVSHRTRPAEPRCSRGRA